MNTHALTIDGIAKSFGDVIAVDNLSASMPTGCIYGFLGPNGAGKTTIIRMIMNIIRPDRGEITILGRPSTGKAKDKIGYMPEERGLYSKMTVRKVLSYLGALKNMTTNELSRIIPQWLDEVDLSDWADKKVEKLSRGMHQKLQFVATVINDPDILILDEPFSGLDPINLELLKSIILRMRNEGKTVIFSTHMMEQAEKLCDAILLINGGRKVIDGSLAHIREQYSSNTVVVETEGDSQFISGIGSVKDIKKSDNKLEIVLKDNADHQEFLRALVDKVRVRSFEVKVPSLHEIFIHLVGQSNE